MVVHDIDFSCPHDEFMDGLRDFLGNWGNGNMNATSVENATRNGRYMYKIEVTNRDDNNVTTMVFEKNANNGDIILVPSGFGSFGGTFHKTEHLQDDVKGNADDTSMAFLKYLEEKAKEKKGKFVAKNNNGSIVCIVNGNSKTAKECVVDSNGSVYGSKEVKSVSLLDGSASSQVNFNTKIGDWNKQRKLEDPEFAKVLSDANMSMTDKMHYIGKYVMELKLNDEIESEEFKDVFIQAGLFTSGFSSNKTLSMMYKLLN